MKEMKELANFCNDTTFKFPLGETLEVQFKFFDRKSNENRDISFLHSLNSRLSLTVPDEAKDIILILKDKKTGIEFIVFWPEASEFHFSLELNLEIRNFSEKFQDMKLTMSVDRELFQKLFNVIIL